MAMLKSEKHLGFGDFLTMGARSLFVRNFILVVVIFVSNISNKDFNQILKCHDSICATVLI